ncbi:MAG: tetratricopeptide repeat protein [Planctomycetales bacterium]
MSRPLTRLLIIVPIALAVGLGILLFHRWHTSPVSNPPPNENSNSSAGAESHQLAAWTPPGDDGWVGSQVCAECHRELFESFQRHPMGQSAAAVHDASPVEDYTRATSFFRPESREYRVERTADGVWHHELMTDDEGELIYDQQVAIDVAIGSGVRGRSYLFARAGAMYVSPVAWYSTTSRWDLAPAYRPLTHPRFGRRALDGCLECHVGRLNFERDVPDRYGTPPIAEWAIGCERCHGPGKEHVQWRRAQEEPDFADPIVNPVRLEAGPREDVCYQCHLQGARILRSGRTAHDFRPGQRLEEIWTVFVQGSQVEQGETTRAVGQVEQMRDSACFHGSDGRLQCVSCHDPHATPRPEERTRFYTSRCLNCHAEKGCSLPADERDAPPALGACGACHMPRLEANNVPHTAQTDHRIVRRPGLASETSRMELPELFDGAEARLPAADLDRARALYLAGQRQQGTDGKALAGLERRLEELHRHNPQDIEVLEALATLCLRQRKFEEARGYWLQVHDLRPRNERAVQQLALYASQTGQVEPAISLYQQAIELTPWQADLHGRLAELLWQAGQREAALDAARQGLETDPTLVPTRRWLAHRYRDLGRDQEADQEERILERMQGR